MTYGRKSQPLFCSLSVLETPEIWTPSPLVCKLTKPPLMRLYDTVHRDSDKRLRNKPKSGHEERVLATQKCLAAGRNGQAFDVRYRLDF